MLEPQLIQDWICAELDCEHIAVEGDGQHFSALIVSTEFADMNRVKRQQRINAILKARFDSGELHALSMKTLTPDEWRANG